MAMPRSIGISQSAGRPVVVSPAAPLTGEQQCRLIQLLAAGLERFLARQTPEPELLNAGAPGVMYVGHSDDEVAHG
jgi:hypothetical protein